MKCCNIKVPMKALAEKLKPLLGLDKYVEKNGGTLTNGVLSTPTIYVEDNRDVIVEVLANCVGDMNITATKGTGWKVNLLCADTAAPKVDFSLPDPFKNVYHIGKARLSDGTSKPTGRTLSWTNPMKEV